MVVRFLILLILVIFSPLACAEEIYTPPFSDAASDSMQLNQMYQSEEITHLQAMSDEANLRAINNQLQTDQLSNMAADLRAQESRR